MNAAFRRVATRAPSAARPIQTSSPRAAVAPLWNSQLPQVSICGGQARFFRNVPSARNSQADKKAKELSQKSVDQAEEQVASRNDAQRQVDDRPWQREDTAEQTQPESVSADPTGGDESKGELKWSS